MNTNILFAAMLAIAITAAVYSVASANITAATDESRKDTSNGMGCVSLVAIIAIVIVAVFA